jgi:hypothetical protein
VNFGDAAQMALHLGGLLGQDVTLEGLTALDAATSATLKRFLALLLVFILGIFCSLMTCRQVVPGGNASTTRKHL